VGQDDDHSTQGDDGVKGNESALDRVLRALTGVMLLALGYFSRTGWLRIVFLAIGAILLITAATGYCTIYSLLRIKTRKE
jgi:uncharacterized membrane protein